MTVFNAAARRLTRKVKFFRDSEKGILSVEAVLILPMLLWAYIGMFTYFEGLRENNVNLKASYTMGDLLSREPNLINMDYLRGMNDVFAALTRSENPTALRVTVVIWDEENNQHKLYWSRGVGKPDLDQEGVDKVITPNAPIMADDDTTVVVETWATFTPLVDIGLAETELYNQIITPPRFSEKLEFEGLGDGTGTTHDDGNDSLNAL